MDKAVLNFDKEIKKLFNEYKDENNTEIDNSLDKIKNNSNEDLNNNIKEEKKKKVK